MTPNGSRAGSSLMDMALAERADLAAFLATLTPEQWDAPSLCSRWNVKDVVAHVISYEELGVLGLAKRFVKGRIVRANEVGVDVNAQGGVYGNALQAALAEGHDRIVELLLSKNAYY